MSKSQNPTKEVIPIMKKRIYRRMPVNDFHPETISPAELGGKLVFAIDVPQGLVSDPTPFKVFGPPLSWRGCAR